MNEGSGSKNKLLVKEESVEADHWQFVQGMDAIFWAENKRETKKFLEMMCWPISETLLRSFLDPLRIVFLVGRVYNQ